MKVFKLERLAWVFFDDFLMTCMDEREGRRRWVCENDDGMKDDYIEFLVYRCRASHKAPHHQCYQ